MTSGKPVSYRKFYVDKMKLKAKYTDNFDLYM